jgi:hypothetical protein
LIKIPFGEKAERLVIDNSSLVEKLANLVVLDDSELIVLISCLPVAVGAVGC